VIYPESFEIKIGFDKVRNFLKEKCLSTLGKDKVDELKFLNSHKRIIKEVSETDEFKDICMSNQEFPVSHYIDATPSLNRIRIEGAFIDTSELFDLKRSLESISAILRFFKNKTEEEYPYLKRLAGNVQVHTYILEQVNLIINKQGIIKDNASPELKQIRHDLFSKSNSVSRRLTSILKDIQKEGWVEKKTSYIEPAEIVELNNEIRELESAERREIVKILIGITNKIRPYIDDLLYAYDFLGTIDFIRAKALFAISLEAIKPSIVNEQIISLFKSRHPLLYLSFKSEKRTVVPLDIQLNKEDRIVLISGPNAGGKSVCLKTVGLIQYMLQSGLLIPVGGASEIGIFDNIFIDIGDEQSIDNDLSTYSSHLLNIILERLNENQTYGVITTHYTNLKHFASSVDGIVNGAMLYDNNKMEPQFQLSIGKPGSSFAFEIARKIGLPEDILTAAQDRIGKDHVDFDKHLRDVLRDKRYWENKRKKIRQSEKKLDELVEKYSDDVKTTEKLRKQILTQAKEDAEQLLANSNKLIENTVRKIKEANADKEKTKKAREDISEFKEKTLKNQKIDDEKINKKIEQLKRREKQLKDRREGKQEEKETEKKIITKNISEDTEIRVGDKVRIKDQSSVGEVMDGNNKSMVVAFGNMITTIKINKLVKISNTEYKKQTKQVGPSTVNVGINLSKKRLNFNPHIDLRGKRADEALQLVVDFIDNAIVYDANEVKILHGTGTGALRQLIRDYLRSVKAIQWYGDEDIQFGGSGITVVQFK
jgi:DNA mismatch repair protein MutS2